jgi:transcriptional regulator with XRE-family HTH domain
MLIRDRIFAKLQELDMTQKEFSRRTGIPESTISDRRKKRPNPTTEKILVICEVLSVTPYWLLSGIEAQGNRGGKPDVYVVYQGTDSGTLIEMFNAMDAKQQEQVLGYITALADMQTEK